MTATGFCDSSNQSEIVMIKLYYCGPGYCSGTHYSTTSSKYGLGSSACCKDSAKPCIVLCRLVVRVHCKGGGGGDFEESRSSVLVAEHISAGQGTVQHRPSISASVCMYVS